MINCHNCNRSQTGYPRPGVITLIEVGPVEAPAGILLQQRAIPPVGGWALTSGFLQVGETWSAGLAREVQEELGWSVSPAAFQLVDVVSSQDGTQLLIRSWCTVRLPSLAELSQVPNAEVLAWQVISQPQELAFPSHTSLVQQYFARRGF